jgi:hypothetical protein
MMSQIGATLERAGHDAFGPSEDDDVLDSWLASLDAREFELILSVLADDRADARTELAPTA